ncbi:zf-RVT domain-containing protein [Cephalotus follicularis]|uniref:Zf-RVT domain-containing protein n=1 Tax=Cephalotus follicularis TaxID=3775 RepID=A0A1Q3BFM4_CEPFO|nr:zf-RVT domain-containing protein [Cephalotus follicularis]
MLRLIWDLLKSRPSLWVRWSKVEILKNCPLWQLERKKALSITWKYLLDLRVQASANLVYSIGRESSWSLWYEPWFQNTSLVSRLGHRVIYESGLPRNATIAMVISDSTWSWPANVRQLREISLACEGIPIAPCDSLDWKVKGRPFSFKAAWEAIRVHHPTAPWAKTVWFPGAIPRHSFCLWLTFHKAHSTLDNLLRLGIVQTSQCPFN